MDGASSKHSRDKNRIWGFRREMWWKETTKHIWAHILELLNITAGIKYIVYYDGDLIWTAWNWGQ